jgi:hypothetical protein
MLPDENVLAAYTIGNDLEEVAPVLRERFRQFVAENRWPSEAVFVDQMHAADPAFPDWPPDWDMGLNLGLDEVSDSAKRSASVEILVEFLVKLHDESGREFALFMCFRSKPWLQEELLSVGAEPVDVAWLNGAIARLIK